MNAEDMLRYENNKLRNENGLLQLDIAILRAKLMAAHGALKPFSEYARMWDSQPYRIPDNLAVTISLSGGPFFSGGPSYRITLGDCRMARLACDTIEMGQVKTNKE